MRLILWHPAVATRDCHDCQRHIYDHATGARLANRFGEPIPRPTGTFAPCRYAAPVERCAKGSPESGREVSAKNRQAWVHFLECRAVGRFPDDAIVRRNAALMEQLERTRGLESRQQLQALVETLVELQHLILPP